MNKLRCRWRIVGLFSVLVCGLGFPACQLDWAAAHAQETQAAPSNPQAEQDLVIESDSQLPDTYPGGQYLVRLLAHGGVPTLHWRVERGALPPGIRLTEDGSLRGEAERDGEFQFTVSVTDSGKPPVVVQKGFVIRVQSVFTVNWKTFAHVTGNRIDGSVEVTNTTADDMDLTFIVLAVAGDGRATAIGYQRFLLRRGTIAKELPFGDTLPHGGYVVHVDAVGEVQSKNLIRRQRLQTASALQVMVGP